MPIIIRKTPRYILPPLHVRLQRIYQLELSAYQKLVLLYYVAYRADHSTGATDVAIATVARECALSRRTVQRTKSELIGMGLLVSEKRPGRSDRIRASFEMVIPHVVPPSWQGAGEGDASGSRTPRATVAHPGRLPDAQSSFVIQKNVQIKSSRPEDAIPFLWKEISKTAEGLTLKNWQWAAARIVARAKTAPRDPVAYLRKSWPRFLAAWPEEVVEWLEEEAVELLPRQSLADAADMLKSRAAEYDLPYNPETIDVALDRALRQLEKQRRLQSELRVGKL